MLTRVTRPASPWVDANAISRGGRSRRARSRAARARAFTVGAVARLADFRMFGDGRQHRLLLQPPLPLPVDPRAFARGERLRLTPRSPARKRDPPDTALDEGDGVAARARMPHEDQRGLAGPPDRLGAPGNATVIHGG